MDPFYNQRGGVIVKHHGPTRTKGARVSLMHAKTGRRKEYDYNSSLWDDPLEFAEDILKKEKLRVQHFIHLKDGWMIVCGLKGFSNFWK